MKTLNLLSAVFIGSALLALPAYADTAVVETEETGSLNSVEIEEGETAAVIDDGEADVKPERSNETHLDLGDELDDDVKVKVDD